MVVGMVSAQQGYVASWQMNIHGNDLGMFSYHHSLTKVASIDVILDRAVRGLLVQWLQHTKLVKLQNYTLRAEAHW